MVSIIGICLLIITLYYNMTFKYGVNLILMCPIRYYLILVPLIVSSFIAMLGFLSWSIKDS